MRILILGGTGTFGSRLALLLADEPGLQITIAGRSRARAEAFCSRWQGTARLAPLAMRREAAALAGHDLVVDASGPFQTYPAPTALAEAAIAAGCDYIDLADGAEFAQDIAKLDTQAKAAGRVVLTAVSTCPVLTGAVLAEMEQHMALRRVTAGIAPSPHVALGESVIRAILTYAGAPIRLWRDGGPAMGLALAERRAARIAPPGGAPMPRLHFALVDVPDLRLLPARWPELEEVWFGAGTRPRWMATALSLLARLRGALHLPALSPFAGLFSAIQRRAKFGSHRGGMFVEAEGVGPYGQRRRLRWDLIAEGDDGPFIPAMPAAALILRWARGARPVPGARSGLGAVSLAEYDTLFASRAIRHGFRLDPPEAPLYRQVLGDAFGGLPPEVRALRDTRAPRRWQGRGSVARGKGVLAGLLARLFAFPPSAEDIEVEVTFTPEGEGERWRRRFGSQGFASWQAVDTGAETGLLTERFGPITVAMALERQGARLAFVPQSWRLWRLPLPGALLPGGRSAEFVEGGRFCFDVSIEAPLIGLIVRYQGWLAPEAGDELGAETGPKPNSG